MFTAMFQKNPVKQSKLFLDYLHLSIRFPPETISLLSKSEQETLYNTFKRFREPISKEHLIDHDNNKIDWMYGNDCPICEWSFHSPLKSTGYFKNSVNIIKQNNWSIGIHFTGGYFVSPNIKGNVKQISIAISNLDDFLYQRLYRLFGKFIRYELKVSRIDFAYNFYGATIHNPKLQARAHPRITDFDIQQRGIDGECTGLSLSKYNTDKVFFRAYDKRWDENIDAIEKAKLRFGTDQFIRNEWRVLPNKMRKLKYEYYDKQTHEYIEGTGIRDWCDWLSLLADKSRVAQLMLHLRKSRDCTYWNGKHPYNTIHLDKKYQSFTHRVTVKPRVHDYQPRKMILGVMRSPKKPLTLDDYQYIYDEILKSTDLIPDHIHLDIKRHWQEQGYLKETYQSILNSQ